MEELNELQTLHRRENDTEPELKNLREKLEGIEERDLKESEQNFGRMSMSQTVSFAQKTGNKCEKMKSRREKYM